MTLGDFQEQVQRELLKWRQPHLLLLYLDIHRRDPHVGGLWVRVLRALWGISGESVQDIRMHDARNARHFAALRADVVARWQGGDGPGFSDTDTYRLKVWLRTLTDACQIRLAGWYGTRCRTHVPAYYMRHKTSANRMGSIPATSAGSTDSLHLYTPSHIRCPGTLTL